MDLNKPLSQQTIGDQLTSYAYMAAISVIVPSAIKTFGILINKKFGKGQDV